MKDSRCKRATLVLGKPGDKQLAILRELSPETDIVVGDNVSQFEAAGPKASVILNWSGASSLLREVFLICPNLRWVHSRSAGLERSLFAELIESSVLLTNGRGVFSASLGEFVLGAILFFAKDFRRMIRNQEDEVWEQFDTLSVCGQTVGIVGYGDIGHAIAARVRTLGIKVIAIKRRMRHQDPFADKVLSPDHLLEMLSLSDYVVVSAPLTEETRGLIDERAFAVMKRTAVIINVGRGPIIDESAMIKALTKGRIKGAALDVYDQEPLPTGHSFYKLKNVLLSPHCADHTPEWLDDAMKFFVSQFQHYTLGEALSNIVNKTLGY